MKSFRYHYFAAIAMLPCLFSTARMAADVAPITAVAGWRLAQPTAGTHQVGIDMLAGRNGKSCGKIVGVSSEKGSRGGFIQEFIGKTQLKPGSSYRYSVSYRSSVPLEGSGRVMIDCYTAEGAKSHKSLVSQSLAATGDWKTLSGQITVPDKVVRVRMLLYLHGRGTLYYDEAFLGPMSEGSTNLLRNGEFEPPDCHIYETAPERRAGTVTFAADFSNATLGKVKQIGPDEFYLHASSEDQPRPSFLWFHFRVDGCQGREITFHMNLTPFSREKTGGNGTRLPVVSYDGDQWIGVADKSWSSDGTMLTFKHRFTQSPAWVASFCPFTADHIARLARKYAGDPCFKTGVVGKTQQNADMPLWTITDPAMPETNKRLILFTTLQHDLETTGATALEGLCRHLLSDDPQMAGLRRGFVFYVVPMMDPDGIAAGNRYCPAGNMNRQWGLSTTPETTNVERFVKQLVAQGRKIDLFMDFHGWCKSGQTTLFLTFGEPLVSAETQKDIQRLADTISPRLTGKIQTVLRTKMVSRVTGGESDLRHLGSGWMQFEGSARMAYTIEIFGDGEQTHQQYLDWGKAFARGIADFYGIAADGR